MDVCAYVSFSFSKARVTLFWTLYPVEHHHRAFPIVGKWRTLGMRIHWPVFLSLFFHTSWILMPSVLFLDPIKFICWTTLLSAIVGIVICHPDLPSEMKEWFPQLLGVLQAALSCQPTTQLPSWREPLLQSHAPFLGEPKEWLIYMGLSRPRLVTPIWYHSERQSQLDGFV